jgi:uncharacterized protein (TIGR00369 family)
VNAETWDRISFARICGIRIRHWDATVVHAEMPFTAEIRNGKGGLHGGAVAALIDHAASAAVAAGLGSSTAARPATVSMTVNYLASTSEGVLARAIVTKAGRRIQFVRVDVVDDSERPIAEGLVTVAVAPSPER